MTINRRKRSTTRRAGMVALGASAALVAASCSSSTTSSSSATTSTGPASTSSASTSGSGAPSGTPVVFHAVVGETGAAAALGSREAKALKALASQVNSTGGIDGHPMQVDVVDNQSNPATAVQLASPWVSQGVPFILNGSIVGTDKAVDALATANGPFIYDLSPGTHPKAGSMIFSAGLSTTADAEAYLTFLKSKGLTNIAVINSTDASGTDGYTQLSTQLATSAFSSFKLVSHQTFDPTSVSVNTQMAAIKAANPQAIVVWTTGTPLGTVLKAMQSLGMDSIPTVTTAGNAAHAELTSFASILPKSIYFPTGPLYLSPSVLPASIGAAVSSFDKAVSAANGHGGDPWGLAWDPGTLLVGALRKLGVNATAKQILNYMQNLQGVAGVYGTYNMSVSNHRGVGVNSIYMTTWNGSSFTAVSGGGGTPLG